MNTPNDNENRSANDQSIDGSSQAQIQSLHQDDWISFPVMPQDPEESDKQQWRDYAADLRMRSDAALYYFLSATYIDWAMNGGLQSDPYYKARLQAMKLSVGNSKKLFAHAVVVTGRIDIKLGSEQDRKSSINTLQETATALEELDKIIVKRKVKVSYHKDCLRRIADIIKDEGGRSKLAAKARAHAKAGTQRNVMPLDTSKAKAVAAKKADDYFAAYGDLVVAMSKDGALTPLENVSFDVRALAVAKASAIPSSPRATGLWELSRMAEAIALESTGKTVQMGDDPKDRDTEKRKTNPHILMRPTGEVVISPISTPSGVLIDCALKTSLLDHLPTATIVLTPNVHRELKRNLDTPIQRCVINIEEKAPAPSTKDVFCTYHLTSQAAEKPEHQPGGNGLSFSWKFASYSGTDDNYLLDLRGGLKWQDHAKLPLAGPNGFLSAIAAMAHQLKQAAQKKHPVRCEVSDHKFNINVDSGTNLPCDAENTIATKFFVNAKDMQGVLAALADLSVGGEHLTLSLDDKKALVRLTFETATGRYQVYIPQCDSRGTRTTDGYERLSIKAPALGTEAAD